MNSIDFCFWLQGFFELSECTSVSEKQLKLIKNHLNLAFVHEIDPLRESETDVTKEQLHAVHATGSHSTFPHLKPGGSGNDERFRC